MLTCNMCGRSDAVVRVDGLGRWHCYEPSQDSPVAYKVAVCQTCGHVFGAWERDMTSHYVNDEYVTCDDDLEQYTAYVQFVLAAVPHRKRRPRILEIGFNRGALLKRFYDLGFECYGIEPGRGNVEAARVAMPEANLDAGFFDVDWLRPFGPGYFDVIMLTSVLEHMPDPGEVMRAARTGLRPDGRLFVVVPDLCFYTPTYQIPARLRGRYGCSQLLFYYRNIFLCYAQHISHFSTPSLKRYLAAHGLQTTQIANVANVWTLAAPAEPSDPSFVYPDLVGFHMRLMDYYQKLLGDMRDAMLNKLTGRTLVCYGAGRELTHFLDVFGRLGVQVSAVADDAVTDSPIHGVPVVRPAELLDIRPDVCLATSFDFEREIAAKAREILPRSVEVLTLTDLIGECEVTIPDFLAHAPQHDAALVWA